MFENLTNFNDFAARILFLYGPDYADRDMPHLPEGVFGNFDTARSSAIISIVAQFPEYHIVSAFDGNLYLNRFVPGATSYYLGEGERSPSLIFDPLKRVDAHFIQSLNSGRSKLRP